MMLVGLGRRVRIEARIGQEMCLRLTARVVASDTRPEPTAETGGGGESHPWHVSLAAARH